MSREFLVRTLTEHGYSADDIDSIVLAFEEDMAARRPKYWQSPEVLASLGLAFGVLALGLVVWAHR